MPKTPPCCTRLKNRLAASQRELTRLARLEAYHAQKGHDISRFPDMLRGQKVEIAKIKGQITEHEAEHAAEYVRELEEAGVIEPEGFELSTDPNVASRQILESAAHFAGERA